MLRDTRRTRLEVDSVRSRPRETRCLAGGGPFPTCLPPTWCGDNCVPAARDCATSHAQLREGQCPLGRKKRKATDHVGVEMRDDVVRDSVGGLFFGGPSLL